ncbi:MAG: pilus assembly protein PilM [Lachnospiraceae bacterium]|nr:pilus assembly protein PilM [Lachnospiraceae bacterium]
MAKRVLSIDISRTLIKACEIDYKVSKRNPVVHQVFTVATPEGQFDDGFITNTDSFGDYLKQKIAENNIKTKSVIFTITSSRVANREALIPVVKDKQIPGIVKANASDYFPVDISGYQLAHSILDTVEQDGAQQLKLLVMAAPKPMLESYYDVARRAGLTVEAIDYSGNSIIPIIKHSLTSEPTMIIKVDEQSTLVTVMKNRAVALQRNINTGAEAAIETLRENGAFGDNLTYQAAINILRTQKLIRKTFDPNVQDEIDDRNESDEIRACKLELTDALRGLVSSIVRVVDYYNSRNSDAPIDRFILTGLGGDFEGLSRLLTHEVDAKVVALSHLEGVGVSHNMLSRRISFGEYLACIGATLQPVDLTLPEYAKGGRAKAEAKAKKGGGLGGDLRTDQLGMIVFVLGLVVAAGLAGYAFYSEFQETANNRQLQAKVTQLEPIELVYKDYQNAQALYEDAVTMYSITQNNNEGIVDFIEELKEKMPSSIGVESLQTDGETLTLSFAVDNEAAIGEVVQNLRTFETINDVLFTSASKEENEACDEVWKATVEAYFVTPVNPYIDEEGAEGEGAETTENTENTAQ